MSSYSFTTRDVNNGFKTGTTVKQSGNLFIQSDWAIPSEREHSNYRGEITKFSEASGIRMGKYLRECEAEYTHMVTLTYPKEFPVNGFECKEHVRKFLQELKRKYARDHQDQTKFSAFWFFEFQARGAPHFHIFITGFVSHAWIAGKWFKTVKSGDVKHLKAGTRTEKLLQGRKGTISYAKKYARKQCQKDVPIDFLNVGRFWGVAGNKKRVAAATSFNAATLLTPLGCSMLESVKNKVNELITLNKARLIKSEDGILLVDITDIGSRYDLVSLISRINAEQKQIIMDQS